MAANISALAMAGAEDFLVPNLPALGEIPRHKGQPQEAALNLLSIGFNDALAMQLDVLESLHDITISRLDTFSIFQDMRNNPSAYGMTNVTGTAKIAGDTTNIANYFDPRVVPNPDEYMFFDDIHPTRVAHAILGNQAAQLAPVPEPGMLAVWSLLATPFAVGALRRRRA